MKNLKRALSFALASVMLLGMMVVGAGAVEFKDADKIENVDAVQTMAALGVIAGKDTGDFDPTGTITRGEMAKIICVMLSGGKEPNLGTSAAAYPDTANHWANSYIAYCANLGIVAGDNHGNFNPDNTVTGTEAAKMLLVALGYDSDVFTFTGASWAINVNTQANKSKLYDGIDALADAPLSRDNAAQMAYNALEAFIMEKTYDKVQSNGQISYNYVLSTTTTFLNEYFDGKIFIGTYMGNSESLNLSADDQIRVQGRLDTEADTVVATANFPSDLSIANIGEEVKVIFKDGKSGTSNRPDKNDTIYGVFNTQNTEVYNVAKSDLQEGKKTSEGKIKFGDNEYQLTASTAEPFVINYNYGVSSANYTTAAAAAAIIENSTVGTGLRTQSGDTIKFVANDEGDIYAAYVVESTIAYVSAVNNAKVTVTTVGSLDVDDNELYEGIAKNDVVAVTKMYPTANRVVKVEKAEAVEGEITGYTKNSGDANSSKVVLDGTTYKVFNKAAMPTSLGEDTGKANFGDDDIGETFTLYMVNGMVAAAVQTSEDAKDYALVIDFNDGVLDNTFNAPQAQLLLADGSKVTVTLHKDSKLYTGANYTNNVALGATAKINTALEKGQIVKYSVVNSSTYKIYEEGIYKSGSSVPVYKKDTKAFDGIVTDGNCPLFVNENGTYKVYNIRNLNDVTTVASSQYYGRATKDGKVVAAFATIAARPSGSTSNMFYGIVSASGGVVKVDDEYYNKYTVANDKDSKTVLLATGDSNRATLATGNLVGFDVTNDDIYDGKNVAVYDGTTFNAAKGLATYVKSFSSADRTLTYWGSIAGSPSAGYTGAAGSEATKALDDDCAIVFVDADGEAGGSDIGVSSFDGVTGYRNVLIVKDSSADKIVAIFVESSGDADILGVTGYPITVNGVSKGNFAVGSTVTVSTLGLPSNYDVTGGTGIGTGGGNWTNESTNVPTTFVMPANAIVITGTGYTVAGNGSAVAGSATSNAGTYSNISVDKTSADYGATITVTVTPTAAVGVAYTDTVTVTMTGDTSGDVTTKTITFVNGDTTTAKNVTFTMPGENVTIAAGVVAAANT